MAKAENRSEHWDFIRGLSMFVMLTLNTSHASNWNPFGFHLAYYGFALVEPIIFLSGFLICLRTVPLASQSDIKTTDIMKRFALRRIVRTWPLYFLLVMLAFIFPRLPDGPIEQSFFSFATFTMNNSLSPYEGLCNLWTLCIEEWCYFIFLLLIPFLRAKGNVPIFFFLAALSFFLRAWTVYALGPFDSSDTFRTYLKFPTLVHMDSFWLGCILAEVYRNRRVPSRQESRLYLVAAGGVLALYLATFNLWTAFFQITIPLWGALMAGLMIWGIQGVSTKTLRKTGLVQFGYVSYTFYLVHKVIGFHAIRMNAHLGWFESGSTLEMLFIYLNIFVIGWALFWIFEAPILKFLRSHLSGGRAVLKNYSLRI